MTRLWHRALLLLYVNLSLATRDSRIRLRKCNNGGCPYAASWLTPVDLFMKIVFPTSSTKMEDASFALLQSRIASVYQMAHPDLYYVNHLSQFEHLLKRKTHNITYSIERSAAVSAAAFRAECNIANSRVLQKERFYLALVPFYGGLPANTDTSNYKVRSVGEGNSVVNRTVKAWQGMATICSLMRFYGRVVVGVSSQDDEAIMRKHLAKLATTNARYDKDVTLVRFHVPRGSNLPFYLLAWAQLRLFNGNCQRRCEKISAQSSAFMPLPKLDCSYCTPNENKTFYLQQLQSVVSPSVDMEPPVKLISENDFIRYIYYTESDQVLFFDSIKTLNVVTSASSLTSVVLGRRRYKQGRKFPDNYEKNLAKGPGCGKEGYYISSDGSIRRDNS